MSTSTKSTVKPETSVASEGALSAAAIEAKAKAEALKAQVAKEVAGLAQAYSALQTAAKEIGPLGLEEISRELGSSVNAVGRPAFGPWLRFNAVLALRASDFKTHDRFYGIAKKAAVEKLVNEDRKSEEDAKKIADKFVSSKGKGSTGKAACTLKMASPAAWDIALGE